MTANGAVPIVEIEAGQQVLSAVDDGLSQDYSSNEVGTKIVVGEAALVQLQLLHEDGSTETINTTDEHPFHVSDMNAWTRADQLLVGDELSTISGTVRLESLVFTSERVPVYNLSIPDSPTYYVGEYGVWVHNANCLAIGVPGKYAHARNTVKAANKHAGKLLYEAHHLIEVRHFKRGTFSGSAAKSPAVALLKTEHAGITKMLQSLLPTGKTYTRSEVRNAYNSAYSAYPEYISAIEAFFKTN